MREYYVRTQYDGKDYLKVFEIYYYDENTGEEVIDDVATAVADGGITCADMGDEALLSIKSQVEVMFKKNGIPFSRVEVEPSEE